MQNKNLENLLHIIRFSTVLTQVVDNNHIANVIMAEILANPVEHKELFDTLDVPYHAYHIRMPIEYANARFKVVEIATKSVTYLYYIGWTMDNKRRPKWYFDHKVISHKPSKFIRKGESK